VGVGLPGGAGGAGRFGAHPRGPAAAERLRGPVEEEAVVGGPQAQAAVGPLAVVDDLQGLLDAGGRGRADVAAVVAVVIMAVRKTSIGIPEEEEEGKVFFLS